MLSGNGYRMRNGNSSDAVAAILNPSSGYREELKRKGVTPRDYERENKLRLKQLQEKKKLQTLKEQEKKEENFKLSKFKSVEPRVYKSNQSDSGSDGNLTPKKHEYLRRGGSSSSTVTSIRTNQTSTEVWPDESASQISDYYPRKSDRRHLKPPIPSLKELEARNAELNRLKHRKSIDYVNSNAWEVINKIPTRGPENTDDQLKLHNNFGKVPKYLVERQEQWAKEEEIRRLSTPDPDCPRGMVRLDEQERIQTLEILRKSQEEARLQMNSLPLRIETPSQIRRKTSLEAKLQEIEDAIKVFSKSKVYVHPNQTTSSTSSVKGSELSADATTSVVRAA